MLQSLPVGDDELFMDPAATLIDAAGGRIAMSLPQKTSHAVVVTVVGLVLAFLAVDNAAAQDPPLASIRAPFTCDTEWLGGTRSGHGLNDWNLDINSTERTFAEPQYDLGAPLLAQADGTIVWIGWHVSAGTYVEIDYGDITARYIHVGDDSVPEGLEIDSDVVEGQLFGLLGDTGNATHAHLHLEYFNSRDYDDARAWLLPSANQIQITMDGVPIEPDQAFVSTNCDGVPPASTTTTTTTMTTTTTTTTLPHPFDDIDAASYAYLDVGLLYEFAITTGTSETNFSPAETVTREQMAAFLGRIWLLHHPLEDNPVENNPAENAAESEESDYPFDDVDPSSFAYEHIRTLFDLGITTGTGPRNYSPGDPVDREQMAAFLNRLHSLLDVESNPGLSPANVPEPEPEPAPAFPFGDVRDDSFARNDIESIWRLGITTGTGPRNYSPGNRVDREQMAAFLARLIRLFETVDQAGAESDAIPED
jgi:hypothetical protein